MKNFKGSNYIFCKGEPDLDSIYKLLDSKASNVYKFKGFNSFVISRLKNLMLVGFNYIERTIKGMFNCDLFMKNADVPTLKKMFPLLCGEEMFNLKEEDDIRMFGRTIEGFRNLNAHYNLLGKRMMCLDFDYSFLAKIEPLNKNIIYLNGKNITIAGIIFIMLCLMREQTISALIKNDFLISLIATGEYRYDDGTYFVNNISHTNLEIDIRKEIGNDLESSIVGEYKKLAEEYYGDFVIRIGTYNTPTYKVKYSVKDNKIFIEQGSLTKTFYNEDYNLEVKNVDKFISFSNHLPPFVFVDYLKEKGIKVFNDQVAANIKKDFELITKLNKPKFYTNKNLKILLLGDTWADFRIVANTFNTRITEIFMLLAGEICTQYNIRKSLSLADILESIGVDANVCKEVSILRNFVAHGYIVGESTIVDYSLFEYTFEFAIETLRKLYDSLDQYLDIKHFFEVKILNNLLMTVLSAKYKCATQASVELLRNPDQTDFESLRKADGWIDNSGFDINLFLGLGEIVKDAPFYSKVYISTIDYPLYLTNTGSSFGLLSNYMALNNLSIKNVKLDGIFKIITIE